MALEQAFGNVSLRLSATARRDPGGLAVAEPHRRDNSGRRQYRTLTFAELDADSDLLADGLLELGAKPGMRLALLVRPGIDFISLTFAMFKAGVVVVLIDPGMGRGGMIRCLEEVEPEGFIAIPLAQVVRNLLRAQFPKAVRNVTVGKPRIGKGPTLAALRKRTLRDDFRPFAATPDDPAAIIFTTGSTGPPKGVLYLHKNFQKQADELRDYYRIAPGEVDLPAFPLFALFNCAMGVATVIPDMDPTRPAKANPRNILEAIEDFRVTQCFGSPALWNVVGRHCESTGAKLPTIRRLFSAGAPAPVHVLTRMVAALSDEADIFTPYGATEALPVASMSGRQVLAETAAKTMGGAGVCVGERFPGIEWKVIAIDDGPIADVAAVRELLRGEIGELMVRGDVVTREYVTQITSNALHKVRDGDSFWHRMGDVGYLDDRDRFWFCGRKAHRVQTASGDLFTIPCEAILNTHPRVYRSALVGIGEPGKQQPVFVVEPWPEKRPKSSADRRQLLQELTELAAGNELTRSVQRILLHRSLPTDIRHNAKIFREKLAVWAARRL
jgi:acyl-CoA synthetase (AMP-forming)/AMP-acid ligase II